MKRRYLILVVAAAAAGLAYLYWRPLPAVSAVSQITAAPKTQSNAIPWPADGQAALGAAGYGLLAQHNDNSPVPIASVAKVITALAVLRQKPLTPGSSGPTITFDNTDLNYFNYYYENDGSVAQVAVGEKISEYQALEAMLIPSANNIADSLARWAFGSIDNYITYANRMAKQMGLSRTSVGSTNGFADKTTSTAGDIVKLGLTAMQNPLITQIVSQSTAAIPVEGTVKNVNYLLGSDGVVGIKTGNTAAAGGDYLFAARQNVLGKPTILVGAVLGAKDLPAAIQAAPPLIAAAAGNFEELKIVDQNQEVGYYQTPWGTTAQLRPAQDLSLTVWKGQDIKILNNFEPLRPPAAAGSQHGSVEVRSGQQAAGAPLVLSQNLTAPSWHWKILRR